jgi:prophage regulatory protein
MPPDLVGLTEIAELLGVSRQRVDQLAAGDDFPEPIAVLAAGRIWNCSDIEAWARRNGRLT